MCNPLNAVCSIFLHLTKPMLTIDDIRAIPLFSTLAVDRT